MFLRINLFLILVLILTLVLLIFLKKDYEIKKTNAALYNLSKAFSYELDESLSLKSRIQLEKSLKQTYEKSLNNLSMIRPNKVLSIEAGK